MSDPGQMFLVRKWDHNTPTATFSFNLGKAKRNKVAVMVFLGEQPRDPKDESEVVDIDAVMLRLGFKRFRPPASADDATSPSSPIARAQGE